MALIDLYIGPKTLMGPTISLDDGETIGLHNNKAYADK